MQKDLIYKSAGIIIRDRKLLVERSQGKDFFISPGGQIEEGESIGKALVRELMEEFSIHTAEEDFEEFGVFEAEAAGREGVVVKIHVFIVKSWKGDPKPSMEVEEIRWIESSNPEGLKLGSIFEHDVIPRLKELDLID